MRMLSLLWSLFNVDEEGKNRFKPEGAGHKISSNSVDVVGLRIILIQLPIGKSNLLVKPALKLKKKRTFQANPSSGSCSSRSSFLKSCCLCNKNLSPDKDVYMYRGDQGFCSVECRSRQIYLDERKEIEASTKRRLPSFRHRGDCNGCKACVLLEELQQRRNIKPLSNYRKNILVI